MKPVYCLAIIYDDGNAYVDTAIKTELQLSALMGNDPNAQIKRVKIQESKSASMTARALFHVWAQQLSGFTGNSVKEQKAALKLEFGYPILKRNEEVWPKLKKLFIGVGWWHLSWEEKLEYSELIPCTSIMSKKELKQMMSDIKNWARDQFQIELSNGKDNG